MKYHKCTKNKRLCLLIGKVLENVSGQTNLFDPSNVSTCVIKKINRIIHCHVNTIVLWKCSCSYDVLMINKSMNGSYDFDFISPLFHSDMYPCVITDDNHLLNIQISFHLMFFLLFCRHSAMLRQYTTTILVVSGSSFKSTTKKTEWCMGKDPIYFTY